MQSLFTPAAQRALDTAATWTNREGCDEVQTPALLLGLLAESECRAAIILAGRGVDAGAVRRRWPELRPRQTPSGGMAASQRRFSAEVARSLQVACERLAAPTRPLELATEHLLLGLVAADHEVSAWLRDHGLDTDTLEAEIRAVYAGQSGPLLIAEEDIERGITLPMPSSAGDPSCLGDQVRITGGGPRQPDEGSEDRGGDDREEVQRDPLAAGMKARSAPSVGGEMVHVLRVVDAAANRSSEGLRAVEDYVRFVLDDRHLTSLCKQLRHDLATVLGRISAQDRLAARETRADVGTALATASEACRHGTAGVLTANFTRLQEALRSLEEYGKLLDADQSCESAATPTMAAELKQLRYRSYTLHRAVGITRASLATLEGARLHVLIDARSSAEQFQRLAGLLVDVGVHMIQLRDKQLDDRRLLERARLLRELTRDSYTLFIVNDRPDLAFLSQADGVHVGQEEPALKDARTIVGPKALVGVSTHTIDEARQAVLDGANYIGVGPVFPSGTKHFDTFPGLDLLRAVAAEIRLPAFAIGGISRENLPEVLAAGFTRIAVAGAVTTAAEPGTAARELLSALT